MKKPPSLTPPAIAICRLPGYVFMAQSEERHSSTLIQRVWDRLGGYTGARREKPLKRLHTTSPSLWKELLLPKHSHLLPGATAACFCEWPRTKRSHPHFLDGKNMPSGKGNIPCLKSCTEARTGLWAEPHYQERQPEVGSTGVEWRCLQAPPGRVPPRQGQGVDLISAGLDFRVVLCLAYK